MKPTCHLEVGRGWGTSMGTAPAGTQCSAVVLPLTGGLERLLFSPPLRILTRETKWKQSWNWGREIEVIKMILFISEK